MASDHQQIEFSGTCVARLDDRRYLVALDPGRRLQDPAEPIEVAVSGALQRRSINALAPGARVRVAVSPYDPTHGLVLRLLPGPIPWPPPGQAAVADHQPA